MEAILKFNLEDSDDKMAHLRCVKSLEMACILFEIQHNLSKRLENYIDLNKPKNNYKLLNIMFEEINELFESNDIHINELIS